jgi:hypothetical protein
MKIFDQPFADQVVQRIDALPENVPPAWGRMNRGQLIGHLNSVIRYTLGEGPEMPFKGNTKTRYLFRPIVMYGLKEIPHNVKVPRIKGMTTEQLFPELPLDVLEASMTTYLNKVAGGGLPARTHPYFGILSARAWQRFHRLHFIHHLKQFRTGDGL